MYSEPSKVVVAGIIVSAVAIVAYVSQSEGLWSSPEDFGPSRGEEPEQRTLGNMVSGVVTTGPAVTRRESSAPTAGADAPQAVHKSPPPADLASAQAPAEVLAPVQKNNEPVRADTVQHAKPAVRVESKPQHRLKPLHASASPVKHGASRESHHAAQKPAVNRATRNAQDQKALDKLVTDIDSRSAPAATPTPAPTQQPVQKSPPVLAEPHSELTSPTPPPSPPSPAVQLASPEAAPVQTDASPKSRAQVRSEISRARADGRLPAFGNPNPAGPGGAPSLTSTPRP
jgi:hypothetical protein